MAAIRGRTLGSMGQMFSPYMVSGTPPPIVGQPFRVRGWGIPTATPQDRPEHWNTRLLPKLKVTG